MVKAYNKDIKNSAETGKKAKKRLSPREKEVYELIIIGKTNREICRELCICKGTLERHITSIYQKKGVKNRFELVFKSRKLPKEGGQ